jgi:hypothetical protein
LELGVDMRKPSFKKPEIEFEPDAWARFESLVKSAARMGHQPHVPPHPKKAVKKKTTARRTKGEKYDRGRA